MATKMIVAELSVQYCSKKGVFSTAGLDFLFQKLGVGDLSLSELWSKKIGYDRR